jgi:hypothetical protein
MRRLLVILLLLAMGACGDFDAQGMFMSHATSVAVGELDIADCAINALSAWTPLEDFSAGCWVIYRTFDEGEYLHEGQEIGTNEELYTRPLLTKAISDFFPKEGN